MFGVSSSQGFAASSGKMFDMSKRNTSPRWIVIAPLLVHASCNICKFRIISSECWIHRVHCAVKSPRVKAKQLQCSTHMKNWQHLFWQNISQTILFTWNFFSRPPLKLFSENFVSNHSEHVCSQGPEYVQISTFMFSLSTNMSSRLFFSTLNLSPFFRPCGFVSCTPLLFQCARGGGGTNSWQGMFMWRFVCGGFKNCPWQSFCYLISHEVLCTCSFAVTLLNPCWDVLANKGSAARKPHHTAHQIKGLPPLTQEESACPSRWLWGDWPLAGGWLLWCCRDRALPRTRKNLAKNVFRLKYSRRQTTLFISKVVDEIFTQSDVHIVTDRIVRVQIHGAGACSEDFVYEPDLNTQAISNEFNGGRSLVALTERKRPAN